MALVLRYSASLHFLWPLEAELALLCRLAGTPFHQHQSVEGRAIIVKTKSGGQTAQEILLLFWRETTPLLLDPRRCDGLQFLQENLKACPLFAKRD